jgi:AcrR family transcriptional regulator
VTATARRRASALPPDQRRSTIIDATIPLLVEHGPNLSTRLIAEAAGLAEGTLFRVFPDKGAIIEAAVEAVLDPEPIERDLGLVDPDLPLLSSSGTTPETRREPMPESRAMIRLFEAHRDELTVSPRVAARALRGLTFALSHPMLIERPAPPREIVRLFLHGVLGEKA